MDQVVGIVAASLLRDTERLEILGRNVLGGVIPGHRAEIPVTTAFAPLLDVLGTEPPVNTVASFEDKRQGALRVTGRSLDFALDGPGWFTVQGAEGVEFTRNGAWHVDANGRLVDGQDRAVLGPGGEEIVVGTGEIAADPDGNLLVDDRAVGRIGIAHETEDAQETARVRQGVLEASNATAADQMVRLIETTRHFSFSAQALKAYDSILNAAIEQVQF